MIKSSGFLSIYCSLPLNSFWQVTYNIEGTPLSLSPDGTVLTPGNRILDVKLMDGTQIVSNGVPVPGVSVTLALVDFLARGRK